MNLENDQYYPANRSGVEPNIVQKISYKWNTPGKYTFMYKQWIIILVN